jgi:hypothetical protein
MSIQVEIYKYSSCLDLKGKIFIPSSQRDLDENRIPTIIQHIKQTLAIGCEPIFGAIILVQLNNKLYIIDGQHRFRSLEEYYRIYNQLIPFIAIVYNIKDPDMMQFIFRTINSGIPVPEYIKHPHGNEERKKLLRTIEIMIKKLPLFGNSVNRPHINVNTFMDTLANSDLIENVQSCDQFARILQEANNRLRVECENPKYRLTNRISDSMLKKCKDYGMYIGVDKNMLWFDTFFDLPNKSKYKLTFPPI